MHNPDDKPSNCLILLMFSNFFNLHAIHEREPWTQHYMWNRMVVVEKKKGEDSLTSTRRINRLWRCPSIDINVSEQGFPCNGCTKSYKCVKAQQKKLSGRASNLLAHEDLGHLRKPIIGIYKPSSIMKISHQYMKVISQETLFFSHFFIWAFSLFFYFVWSLIPTYG